MKLIDQKNVMMSIQKIYRVIMPMVIYNYPFYLQNKFIKRLAKLAKGKKVLDAGAGECPFKPLFKESEYVAQDIGEIDAIFDYSKIDVSSDIYDIPVPENSFDFVLCSEVLEHLQYPDRAIKEFKRLLKNGGQIWITVPFSGGLHQEPYDFYRYTKYALEGFAKDNELSTVEITPLGGAFTYLSLVVKNIGSNISDTPLAYVLWSIILFPIILVLSPVLFLLDKMDNLKKLTTGYLVIYEK